MTKIGPLWGHLTHLSQPLLLPPSKLEHWEDVASMMPMFNFAVASMFVHVMPDMYTGGDQSIWLGFGASAVDLRPQSLVKK